MTVRLLLGVTKRRSDALPSPTLAEGVFSSDFPASELEDVTTAHLDNRPILAAAAVKSRSVRSRAPTSSVTSKSSCSMILVTVRVSGLTEARHRPLQAQDRRHCAARCSRRRMWPLLGQAIPSSRCT